MDLPERIGRYVVVGHLASGGMAEIFLGKLVGPSGFERPVVIKRILPSLANKESFVQMFLDEARVVSRIQHENVVQVFELGESDDALFLAMEYLGGESALGLMRRAARQKVRIDPALGAYIVMRAAAGLHAAHELCDPDGQNLNLVHRDVSPSNLFLTYTGGVKVLDFGIAKFAERESKTEAGELKGKFAYMSPEQCLAQPLDRRSDIFSLGTVLFELTTGRRLFVRDSQMLTMKAICERPIPSPRKVSPDYPDALEAIFRKACAREREERYATAAEMRRELAEALRTLEGPAVPEEALASLMRQLFDDRLGEKNEMLRRVQAGSQITQVPQAEADASIELPVAEQLTQGAVTPLGVAQTPTKRSTAPLIVAAAVALIAAAAGGGFALLGDDEPAPLPDEPALAAAEPAPSPEPEPAPEQRPAFVSLHVETVPPGAEVSVAGQVRGRTPIDLQLARGQAPLGLQLTLDGYVAHTAEHVPSADDELHVELTRAAPARPAAGRRGRGRARPRTGSGDQSPFRRFN